VEQRLKMTQAGTMACCKTMFLYSSANLDVVNLDVVSPMVVEVWVLVVVVSSIDRPMLVA
jgi:hypothetical protein